MTSSIHERVDAFVTGGYPPEAFLSELSSLCDANPDATWEILALLDQYHRRGKLSGETHRKFRRHLEFHALGIADPDTIRARADAGLESVAATADSDEVRLLRMALASEQEKSRRYRHRIATLAVYGIRQRTSLRSRATAEVPHERHRINPGAWIAGVRRYQRSHVGMSAAVLMAAATVISGSASNRGFVPDIVAATSAMVAVGKVQELPMPPILEPQVISLSSARFLVVPGSRTASIQVDRTGGTGVVKFKWWTQSAGAKAGRDYAFGKPRTAQIAAGEESVQLSVPILANASRKHTEMFYVGIGAPSEGASLGTISRATVFIMRSDWN